MLASCRPIGLSRQNEVLPPPTIKFCQLKNVAFRSERSAYIQSFNLIYYNHCVPTHICFLQVLPWDFRDDEDNRPNHRPPTSSKWTGSLSLFSSWSHICRLVKSTIIVEIISSLRHSCINYLFLYLEFCTSSNLPVMRVGPILSTTCVPFMGTYDMW